MAPQALDQRSSEPTQLCYLSADRVEGPFEKFDDFEVVSRENQHIGHFDGIIIDPSERQVRYLVVDEAKFLRHHRYLLPMAPTQVDAEHHALRVDLDREDLSHADSFDAATYRRFSDDDLITALFARPGA